MTQPLDGGQREAGRRHLKREALTDESGQLLLVLQDIDRRDNAAGAVSKQEDRQPRMTGLCESDRRGDVADVVRDILDEEPFTVGSAAAPQIERVDGKAGGGELFAGPQILPAVGIDAVTDDDHRARRGRTP